MTNNNNLPLIFKGCSENNLKDIDVELPSNQLIVITGLSGSGKSSLAFHTIYAEGQRRYIETFSPYTRQFLDKLKKPEILYSENMRPAIAIEQKTRIRSSRSTVGSMTHCKELLKSIWPYLATLYCPKTNKPLKRYEVKDVAKELENKINKNKDSKVVIYIGTDIKLPRKKEERIAQLENLVQKGFNRFMDAKNFERFKFERRKYRSKTTKQYFCTT
ncbi:UNVERIFIED_CONTAM: hypothetical protein GTU68_005279 [Idotea baltica]|nr:hypothetical protein [Idotea baltica]